MPTPSQATNKTAESDDSRGDFPNCLAIAERGIRTAQDFAKFMSLMMGDVITGRMSALKASTATRAGCAMLKVIEMQYRYGSESEQPGKKSLRLID